MWGYLFIIVVIAIQLNVSLRLTNDSVLAIIAWGGSIIVSILLFVSHKIKPKSNYALLVCLCIFFIIHLSTTKDKPISILMYFSGFFFMINMDDNRLISRKILISFIIFPIISCMIFFSDFIKAISSLNSENAFVGFTTNSNTNSTLGYLFFFSVYFLFYRQKSLMYYLLLALSSLYIISCMSRNSILSILIFLILIYIGKKTKNFNLYATTIILIILLVFFYYMMSSTESYIELFGKGATSSSRSDQIKYTISNYDITLFGYGRDLINHSTRDFFGVALHNTYLNTLYSFGVVYVTIYIFYFITFYKKLKLIETRSAILAVHVYYFFEPAIFFELGITSLLMYIVILVADRLNSNIIVPRDEFITS